MTFVLLKHQFLGMMPMGFGKFVMVFAIAELYPWFQGLGLPVPILIAAGVLMAVTANRGKQINLPWRSPHAPPLQASKSKLPTQPPTQPSTPPIKVIPDPTPVQPPRRGPELPKFNVPTSLGKPISFKIRKPD